MIQETYQDATSFKTLKFNILDNESKIFVCIHLITITNNNMV
jgi:hypothetical protein